MDLWNPQQYRKFQSERARPFWDLAKRIDFEKVQSMLDIGCGTGELTQALHAAHEIPKTIGIDPSAKMLEQARAIAGRGLTFEPFAVENYVPPEHFDLVLSNAALQWTNGHRGLFPKIVGWLKPGGQIAIQMPFNIEHPSHKIAGLTAQEFGLVPRENSLLEPEEYVRLFWSLGLRRIDVSLRIYPHPLPDAQSVVEWTKGTLLTHYQKQLTPERFEEFVKAYTSRLLKEIGEGSYLYTFRRIFLYAVKD